MNVKAIVEKVLNQPEEFHTEDFMCLGYGTNEFEEGSLSDILQLDISEIYSEDWENKEILLQPGFYGASDKYKYYITRGFYAAIETLAAIGEQAFIPMDKQ